MKKLLVGILILIPIIILLMVAAVTQIVSVQAVIGVESISLSNKDGVSETLTLSLGEVGGKILNFNDFLTAKILPEHATDKTVKWSIEDLEYKDADYKAGYEYYINHKDEEGVKVYLPAAFMLGADDESETPSNTTGSFRIMSYCSFYVNATADTKSARYFVYVTGYDVEGASISDGSGVEGSISSGEARRLSAVFTPADSIVNELIWQSSNTSVAVVDANGVVKGVGEGSAEITFKARVYSSQGADKTPVYVLSRPYTLTVAAGASATFGNKYVAYRDEIAVEDLKLNGPITATQNCVYNSSDGTIKLNLNSQTEQITVATPGGSRTMSIERCGEDEIVIENADIFNYAAGKADGFVFEVGGIKLKLTARWKAYDRAGQPQIEWTCSDTDVASVSADGSYAYVTAVSNGIAAITAAYGNSEYKAVLNLNVREKVASVSLSTTTKSFMTGIANQTVLPSTKYAQDGGRVANGFGVKFAYPLAPQDDEELSLFYSAFNFVFVTGAGEASETDYAYFNGNEIVFKPENIRGKMDVSVKVSAKYPRYESIASYTTVYFTFTVANGVLVNDYDEAVRAEADQKTAYAAAQEKLAADENYTYQDSLSDRLSICLGGDVMFPERGEGWIAGEYCWELYGNLYGNNRLVAAEFRNVGGSLFYVRADGTTISNAIIRANRVEGEISNVGDNQGMKGCAVIVESATEYRQVLDVNVEFSILENASILLELLNADVTVNGCIMRNTSSQGIYVPTRGEKDDGSHRFKYGNLVIKNCVSSNMLATAAVFAYENYSVTDSNDNNSKRSWWNDALVGKPVDEGGIPNSSIKVEGFWDIYNWQPTSTAQFIPGDLQESLGAFVDLIFSEPFFEPYRYRYQNELYVHLGFVAYGPFEDIYIAPEIEDSRFVTFNAKNVSGGILGDLLNKLSAQMWLYGNNEKVLTPGSAYSVQSILGHLRGEAA